MSPFGSKLILVSVFALSVCPLLADIVSVPVPGGTLYDCGQLGSANLQSCINAMNLGEAQFLASYSASGSPLPGNWASILPPPPLPCPSPAACSYTLAPQSISTDMLSQIIFETDFPTYNDTWASYIWHNGAFTSADPFLRSFDLTADGGQAAINDQGGVADTDEAAGRAWAPGAGYISPYASLSFGWTVLGPLVLNDDNQVLFEGLDPNVDYILYDPLGAPIPGVPEPASLALLATILALAIPLLRKRQFR